MAPTFGVPTPKLDSLSVATTCLPPTTKMPATTPLPRPDPATMSDEFAKSILIHRDIEAALGGKAQYGVCQLDGAKTGTQIAITLPPRTAGRLADALPEFAALIDIWVKHGTPFVAKPRNCLQLVFKDVSEAEYPLVKLMLSTYYMTSDRLLLQKLCVVGDDNGNHDVIGTYALTKRAKDALADMPFERLGRLLSGDY